MNLILQATEQVDQNTTPPEGGPKLLTSTTVTAGAPYSLLLPKSGSAIVLELVGDADGSGSATAGEWFGVQDGQGNNKADMDRADVNINVTLCAGGESTAVSTPNNAQGPAPQDPPPPPEAGAGGPPPVDGAPAGDAPGAIPAPQ